MLYFNHHNIDDENAAYVQACLAQRERMNVTVSEQDVLTAEELDMIADYESDILDREWHARGQW